MGNAFYASSKIALSNYVKSLAFELMHTNINVNSIAPSIVVNKSFEKYNQNYWEIIDKFHPRGYIDVNDISKLCLFLLSNNAKSIHGQEIVIDKGYSITI